MTAHDPRFLEGDTEALRSRQREAFDEAEDRFEGAKTLVGALGAHWHGEHATFGFWTPELPAAGVPPEAVELELLTATEPVDLSGEPERITFARDRVATRRAGEFTWAAIEGVRPGTREDVGTLYRLVYERDGERHTVGDPLASSLPFGAFAPAELYDLDSLDRERADRAYFEALGTDAEPVPTTDDGGLPRIDPATSMLEIHPRTATGAGSLGGLARRYEAIGRKLRAGEPLSPAERNFVGYDAVQLMPLEPITENEEHPGYWREPESGSGPGEDGGDGRDDDSGDGDRLRVTVERPSQVNWGYDIVVSGFSAVNPSILETGRPDELVDLIAACHGLPDPIRVVFDIALGHADGSADALLDERYFAGPGMYGLELDYTQPVVRAILLELQRRKMDFGADGIRVDGAQDFTAHSEERGEYHDDAFLAEMNDVVQTVADSAYRPWMIYEDGRPWPRPDWELASDYRTLIEQHPDAFQWSPVTFAHNTPAILTFWARKWWRVREVADFGSHWITGVANHDTLRRGAQQPVGDDWRADPMNPHFGESPPDAIEAAYDSPATNALFHCFLPGVPMDFLNANFRAPWAFVRDTDAVWNVKVVAEEHNFLEWRIREADYADDRFFPRLKGLGFSDRESLSAFSRGLAMAVEATDFEPGATAEMLSALETPFGEVTVGDLEAFAEAWTRDVAGFANLSNWADAQDETRTAFERRLREFRAERPWLRSDLDPETDRFAYAHPTEGAVLYYGLRRAPDGSEELLFVGNMEGTSRTVTPVDLVEADQGGWEPAVLAPGVDGAAADEPLRLANAEAAVFRREP